MKSLNGLQKKDLIRYSIYTFIFQTVSFLVPFFLIPLLLIKRKVDSNKFYVVGVLTLLASSCLKFFLLKDDGQVGIELIVVLTIGFPILIFIEFCLADLINWQFNIRRIFSTLISCLFVGTVVFVAFFILDYFKIIEGTLASYYEYVKTVAVDFMSKLQVKESFNEFVTLEDFSSTLQKMFLQFFIAINYFIILLNMRIADNFMLEKIERKKSTILIKEFTLPEKFIWFLLVSWLIIVLVNIFNIEYKPFNIFYNFAYIAVVLYVVQGIGVIVDFVLKRNNPYYLLALIFIPLILLFVPMGDLIFLVFLSGLGVSDIWVNYRKK